MLTTDMLAEAIAASGIKRDKTPGRASIELATKAATDTIVSPSPGTTWYDPSVVITPRKAGGIRDLIPEVPVSTGSVGIYRTTSTGSFGVVREDQAKAQRNDAFALQVYTLTNVAGILKVADEILDDYPRLVAAIEQDARYEKDRQVEWQIMHGTGASGQMSGFMYGTNVAQANTSPLANQGAWAQWVQPIVAAGYMPDAWIVNRGMWTNLVGDAFQATATIYKASAASDIATSTSLTMGPLGKANRLEFDGGQMFLYGIPVYLNPNSSISSMSVLLGDFARGAKIYSQGEKIDIGYDNADFSHNRVTIRIVERLTMVIRDKNAFMRSQTT